MTYNALTSHNKSAWQFFTHSFQESCKKAYFFINNSHFYENDLTCHVLSCHVRVWHGSKTSQLVVPITQLPFRKILFKFLAHFYKKWPFLWKCHVMSCHFTSHHSMSWYWDISIVVTFHADVISKELWWIFSQEEPVCTANLAKSCHVISCHVKTGSRHNFSFRIRSNSERGYQIEPVCIFSCF